jgi:hypothetical protein
VQRLGGAIERHAPLRFVLLVSQARFFYADDIFHDVEERLSASKILTASKPLADGFCLLPGKGEANRRCALAIAAETYFLSCRPATKYEKPLPRAFLPHP